MADALRILHTHLPALSPSSSPSEPTSSSSSSSIFERLITDVVSCSDPVSSSTVGYYSAQKLGCLLDEEAYTSILLPVLRQLVAFTTRRERSEEDFFLFFGMDKSGRGEGRSQEDCGTTAQVVIQVCLKAQAVMREIAIQAVVALPKLTGVRWTVYTTLAQSESSGGNERAGRGSSALVTLNVEGEALERSACPPRQREVSFTATQGGINAMVASLSGIRDQLTRIAGS